MTYIKMIMLYMVLGSVILYFAGKPLVKLMIAEWKMIISQGAPDDPNNIETNVTKLVLTKNSTSDPSEIQVPIPDTRYGTITSEAIALSAPLYYGDSETSLENGAAQFPGGNLPGQGKPILISGHDATFFAPLEQVRIGDIVTINTDYGTFEYSITSKIVAEANDPAAYDLSMDKEQLILYTCYPFGQLVGERSKRFFVYCDRILASDTE